MQLPAVFRRSNTLLLLEHAAEVLGILETEPVRHLRHGFTGCQSILGKPDDKPTDVVAGRISGGLLDDITEIIGRQAQLVRTILHGRQTEGELQFVLEIVTKQTVETDENVGILHLAGQELPVVEPLAEVKHQFDVAHENGILELVRFLTQLVLYLAHERHKYVMLLIGHVQGLIDSIFKKGVILHVSFEREAMQQVRMEKQRPARNRHPFAVVFLASHLSGGHTQQRAFVVVIFAAAIIQIHIGIVPEKKRVHAVVVQTMTYGGHFGIVHHSDQRMPHGATEITSVVIYISYFQYLAHILSG